MDPRIMHSDAGYSVLTLNDIFLRTQTVFSKVPHVPSSRFLRQGAAVLPDCAAANAVSSSVEGDTEMEEEGENTSCEAAAVNNKEEIFSCAIAPVLSSGCVGGAVGQRFNTTEVQAWARALQDVLEEYYLVLTLIDVVIEPFFSGLAEELKRRFRLLSSEAELSKKVLASQIEPMLQDILSPAYTQVKDTMTTTTTPAAAANHASTSSPKAAAAAKTTCTSYTYRNILTDPQKVEQAYKRLALKAELIRQVVLGNIDRVIRALAHYLEAQSVAISLGVAAQHQQQQSSSPPQVVPREPASSTPDPPAPSSSHHRQSQHQSYPTE